MTERTGQIDTPHGWDICQPHLVSTVEDLSASLKKDLEKIHDVRLISFDDLVRDNVKDNPPRSVDAIFFTSSKVGSKTVFVEFKGWPEILIEDEDKAIHKEKEMRDAVSMKAVESIHLFHRFIEESAPEKTKYTCLILVDNRSASKIGSITRSHGPKDMNRRRPEFLRKYASVDLQGKPLFYDEVWECTPEAFIRFIGKERITFPLQSEH